MSDEVLRFLDGAVEGAQTEVPGLSDGSLQALHETMLLTETIEERCATLHAESRIGFWVPSLHGMAAAVGAARAFHESDWIYPPLRDTGVFLVRGGGMRRFFEQLYGTEGDVARGRRLPGSACLPGGRYVTVSPIAGAQILHAAGTAIAMKIRGDTGAVLSCFGPGAVDQSGFHQGLGHAARHRAPVVFLCRGRAGDDGPVRRARAYGLPTTRLDGDDVLAAYIAGLEARTRAVDGEGPVFLDAVPASDAEPRSPRRRFRAFLESRGLWDAEQEEEVGDRCRELVERAIQSAESAPAPQPESAFEDVLAEPSWMVQEQAENWPRDGNGG